MNSAKILLPDPSSPTSGIQEALHRLSPDGGSVNLGPGEFLVSDSIRLPDRATLVGSGPSTVVRMAAGSGKPGEETHVITNQNLDSGHEIAVRDLCVDANFRAQAWEPSDLGGGGIAFDGASNVTVERVEVHDTWRHGIWFLNGTGARVIDCDVHTVGCSCISIGGQHHFRRFTEDVVIRGCRLSDCRKEIGRRAGNCGIEIKDHTRRVQVAECQSFNHEGFGFAVLVHAGKHPAQAVSDIVFTNCQTFGCIHGFAIGTTGDFPITDVSVTGCHAFNNRKSGLCIHAAKGGLTGSIGVTGSTFHHNLEHGVVIEGEGFAGIVISANRIHGNGRTGLAAPPNDPAITDHANILWNNDSRESSGAGTLCPRDGVVGG